MFVQICVGLWNYTNKNTCGFIVEQISGFKAIRSNLSNTDTGGFDIIQFDTLHDAQKWMMNINK